MWPESDDNRKTLRTGLTTGSCATACSVAAANCLLNSKEVDKVTITLPRGERVELDISEYVRAENHVRAACIKDAGDDPDVTHGATIFVDVVLRKTAGVEFCAGEGVGTVTRPGLALAVDEPAINPVPRQMMADNLQQLAQQSSYDGGFVVKVGVVNGEQIAEKTMNGRLGIVGGLSILGTTGIVRPFSCAAWIASIHQGIDVASANGIQHIAASTGNASEAAIQQHYQLTDVALIEMGDFAGAVLKHLKKVPVSKLSICGGFGKITKLANRHMDLNSRASIIDFEHMSYSAKALGADGTLCKKILSANTSIEVLAWCQQAGIDLADDMCQQAQAFAESIVPESVQVEVWTINRKGEFVGSAGV